MVSPGLDRTTWIFLRHGESIANADGWLSGHCDVALTPKGEEQARLVRGELNTMALDRVLCSDLIRARHTAALALGDRDVPISYHFELRERHLGDYEGQQKSELRADGRMDELLTWTGAAPNGESHLDMAQRALPFLARMPPVPTTLISAHGGMIRTLVGLLDNDNLAELGTKWVHNCELAHRSVPSGTWSRLAQRFCPDF